MQTNVEIVGTLFHPLPASETLRSGTVYVRNGVSCKEADAVLMPESDAVKVLIPLSDGTVFHLGYLPKDSGLKQKIKTMHPARICYEKDPRKDYPSWTVIEVYGL